MESTTSTTWFGRLMCRECDRTWGRFVFSPGEGLTRVRGGRTVRSDGLGDASGHPTRTRGSRFHWWVQDDYDPARARALAQGIEHLRGLSLADWEEGCRKRGNVWAIGPKSSDGSPRHPMSPDELQLVRVADLMRSDRRGEEVQLLDYLESTETYGFKCSCERAPTTVSRRGLARLLERRSYPRDVFL